MAADTEFIDYVLDLLDPIPDVASGRFFGGTGLTAAGTQFAMVMGGALYFVVNDQTRPKYEAAGMPPFSYATKKGRVNVKRYYQVPVDILETPPELIEWAEESIQIARKTKKK